MAVAANPSFAVSLDASGTIDGNFTFNPQGVGATAINWTALLQWLTTYGPNVIAAFAALIAIFGSPTPAPPAPTTGALPRAEL
ncbi:MAG: hypothetical protein ACXWPK_08255 [Isosphaeraceae bacterium]